jgi:hypothetical protein
MSALPRQVHFTPIRRHRRFDCSKRSGLERIAEGAHSEMATIVQCDCGAEYKRIETRFLVPPPGHASRKVCGAALESRLESTHVATFELVNPQEG